MDNRFERLSLLVGDNNLEKLKSKRVVILGVGGVGGYVVESLARCGIGNFLIVDSDTIDITNINRQIIATDSSIGEYKVDVFKKRLLDINPNINVETSKDFINEGNYLSLFRGNVDYFIDCCDTLKTKELVIRYALLNDIPIISSMGAGARFNPSLLSITDIKKTSYDPIARRLRKFLKDEHINKKLIVMCSHEKPLKVHGSIPSNSFVPASAGLLISSYVFKQLIKRNL